MANGPLTKNPAAVEAEIERLTAEFEARLAKGESVESLMASVGLTPQMQPWAKTHTEMFGAPPGTAGFGIPQAEAARFQHQKGRQAAFELEQAGRPGGALPKPAAPGAPKLVAPQQPFGTGNVAGRIGNTAADIANMLIAGDEDDDLGKFLGMMGLVPAVGGAISGAAKLPGLVDDVLQRLRPQPKPVAAPTGLGSVPDFPPGPHPFDLDPFNPANVPGDITAGAAPLHFGAFQIPANRAKILSQEDVAQEAVKRAVKKRKKKSATPSE